MSNTITTLKAQIADIKASIVPVQTLSDQLAAMQKAAADLVGLKDTLSVLEQRLSDAETAEKLKAAAVGRISIVRVSSSDTTVGPMSSFVVRFVEKCTNAYGQPDVRDGSLSLIGLTPEVYAALLADANKLPMVVRALGDTPDEAVRAYCANMRRGFIKS